MRYPSGLLRLILILGLLSMAAVVLPAGCARLEPEPEPMTAHFWPDGDGSAGRQAFQDLKCYQCHRVASVPGLAALNEEPLGPALDSDTARRTRMDILVQIVAPGTDPSIQESHMGNFDEVMTVAQLTDLIAFVESLHG